MTDQADHDPTDEISDIESRIEALAEIAGRCRKFILASRIAIACGCVLPLAMVFGFFVATAVALLGSIALVLGGIVSLGSNVSTLRETEADISEAEAMRSQLIDTTDLRLVHDAPTKLM